MDLSKIPSPCFVLDESLLIRNLERAKDFQTRAPITLLLALKGFALPRAFPLMRQTLCGVTASSLSEAILGKEEFKGDVHIYAPAYSDAEIDSLLTIASHITFNSLSQWRRFAGKTVAANVSPGLRINPEYSPVETDLYNPCVKGSRLGVTRRLLGEKLPQGIEGLHCHNLCECDSHALEKTLAAIEANFGDLLPKLQWLNLGGGHLFNASNYDLEHAISQLQGFHSCYPNLKIILEPGAAYVWQTGYLVSSVLDVVETEEGQVLMLDSSFAAHMPDCLEMPYKPRIQGANINGEGKFQYRLGGMTCLAGDQMSAYGFATEVKVGDKLVFEDMMHYTFVKTTFFNGVAHPSLGIWTKDNNFELIRSFGYQDYKAKLC